MDTGKGALALVCVDGDNLLHTPRVMPVPNPSDGGEITRFFLNLGGEAAEYSDLRFYHTMPNVSRLRRHWKRFFHTMRQCGWNIFWDDAREYDPQDVDFYFHRHKGIPDVRIALDAAEVLFAPSSVSLRRLVLASGDSDFVPLLCLARKLKVPTVVVSQEKSLAPDLGKTADRVVLWTADHEKMLYGE